jgi:hypothetical protein
LFCFSAYSTKRPYYYGTLSVNLGSLLDLGRHPPSLELFLGPM